jgi:subtilisin family serine protease
VGNNGIGIAGVNWQCKMVAIKFMDATGIGTEANAIAAIGYSVAVGCKLTNNSWGNMSGGQAMLDAINAAGAAGQLMVFAAGNNGWNIDSVPFWPPSYMAPNMITVTSTDGRDQRPTLTNFGAVTVNLGAPGYGVYSCKPGNLYQTLNGTSMAAPHVTGAAALAMAHSPLATGAQIRQLILLSTDPIASMAGATSTGGRLNANKLMQFVVVGVEGAPHASFGLRAKSPSPGPRPVELELTLAHAGRVEITLFDVQGRRVARLFDGTLPTGAHAIRWDGATSTGARVGSGVYFARARTNDGARALRLVIVE